MSGNDSAFPVIAGHMEGFGPAQGKDSVGLSKRELFAAMAMQGICARNKDAAGDILTHIPTVASTAVRYADALIAELEKTAPLIPPRGE